MRIGFASIYSYRPHVEHLFYLSRLAAEAGHQTYFLTCDAQLETCYTRELKGASALIECPKCIIGGVRSFVHGRIDTLSIPNDGSISLERAREFARSSVYTIVRTETATDNDRHEVRSLLDHFTPATSRAYASTRTWIQKNRLEAIVAFNGRMDATRALTEAAADLGVPFITNERTWFGDGLMLFPNANVLDLKHLDIMNSRYRKIPLTRQQARRVARHVASRFLKRNDKEWRAYNLNAVSAPWPAAGKGPRTLVLPSSRNESEGHPDWAMEWPDCASALDAAFDALGIDCDAAVLRCHPNWGERIGHRTGRLSEQFYTEWASRRGVHCIPSTARESTFELIRQADLVIVNGGSAALEAGALGKPVVTLGPATYRTAGFCINATSPASISEINRVWSLSRKDIVRHTLRYGYTYIYRMPQYVDYVRADSSARYRYYSGADPQRLLQMFTTQRIEPDDAAVADDEHEENEVCNLVLSERWEELLSFEDALPQRTALKVRRRPMLRWVDGVRALLPRGDA
jgi:hypothetical protein